MNFLSLFTTLLPLALEIVQAIPSIKSAYDSAAGNTLQKVQAALPAKLVNELANVGGQLFPNLSPELHAAAAALIIAHPNAVAYVQDALNIIASTGYFQLPNNQQLAVDGIYGPKTRAAIQAFETKVGIPVTNAITDALNNAIGAVLAKI